MRTHLMTVVVCLLAGSSMGAAQPAVQGGIFGGPGSTTLTVAGVYGFSLDEAEQRWLAFLGS